MKTIQINKMLYITVFFIFLATSCKTGSYTLEFKNEKKKIDTLTYIRPFVQVVTYKGLDTSLINLNSILITRTTSDLLGKKYHIVECESNNFDYASVFDKIRDIDKSNVQFKNISISKFLEQKDFQINSRFALLIFFGGTYNPNFETDYNIKNWIFSNVTIINSWAKVQSEGIVIIIDTFSKEIVYYNRISSKNYDPRKDGEVEKLIQYLLQWLYYK
jgi:hypothetical protein